MKKVILSLILVIAVLFSCALPAFASWEDEWILASDASYIRHGQKYYYPMEQYSYSPYETVKGLKGESLIKTTTLGFADNATRDEYRGATVSYTEGSKDYAVMFDSTQQWQSALYVEESYMMDYLALKNGEAKDFFVLNYYEFELALDADAYDRLDDGKQLVSEEGVLGFSKSFDRWDVYAYDAEKDVVAVVGEILYSGNYSDDFYFLKYSDYDSSYFYADGSFELYSYDKVCLYHIDDSQLAAQMIELAKQVPEDELDWLAGAGRTKGRAITIGAIFFVALPLAVCVFCAIKLRRKNKTYRFPLVALLCTSLVMALSAMSIFLWIM